MNKLLILIILPTTILVIVAAILTFDSNNRLIRFQAENMAQTVANQVITDRAHYVERVVKKLEGTDFAPPKSISPTTRHMFLCQRHSLWALLRISVPSNRNTSTS